MPGYISYKIPDCSGHTTMFLYPYGGNIKAPDSCSVNNAASLKPFMNSQLRQTFSASDAGLTEKWSSGMNRVLVSFKNSLSSVANQAKTDFCNGFSTQDTQAGLPSEYPKSNKDFCVQQLGVATEDAQTVNENACKTALTVIKYSASPLQKQCIAKFANFDVYFLNEASFKQNYSDKWAFDEIYNDSDRFDYVNEKNINDLRYVINMEFYHPATSPIDTWDGIKISETSVNGFLYKNAYLSYKQLAYTDQKTQRTDLEEIAIGNNTVYIEHVTTTLPDGNGASKQNNYEIAHFIKGSTYFQISYQPSTVFPGDAPKTKQERIDILKKLAKNFIDQPIGKETAKLCSTSMTMAISPPLISYILKKGVRYASFPEAGSPITFTINPNGLIHWKAKISGDWIAAVSEGFAKSGDTALTGISGAVAEQLPVGTYDGTIAYVSDSCGESSPQIVTVKLTITN